MKKLALLGLLTLTSCGQADEPILPIEEIIPETESVIYPIPTSFGHITYYPLGLIEICD